MSAAKTCYRDHLSPAEVEALDEFCQRLLRALPHQVQDIILFGSKARGDAHLGSDIDLLVVLDPFTKEADTLVSDITADLLLECGVDISAITFSRRQVAELSALGTPLMRNVAEEGIPLKGEPIVVGEGKPYEVAKGFLRSAHERLRATRVLIKGGFYRSAVSEAYYAFLDAADGALASRRITPKSHAGTISLFGLHFIKPGLVDAKYSRWFKLIRKARMYADYHRLRSFSRQEAEEALAQAAEFVSVVEALINRELQSQQHRKATK